MTSVGKGEETEGKKRSHTCTFSLSVALTIREATIRYSEGRELDLNFTVKYHSVDKQKIFVKKN